MSLLSRIIALMLWPLETLGRLLAGSVRFLAVFSGKLLRSPWGLLVPVTFLAVLFLAVQLDKGPRELALHYALELEQADESRRRVLVAALLDLGDPGIEGLVQGLRSRREAVFLACREALEHELNRWETLDDPSERSRRYRVLSETLSENAREFRPVARTTALAMTQRMLQYLATSAREIEHTPPPTGYQSIRQETQRGWYRDRASARRQYPRDSRFAPDLAKDREFLSRSQGLETQRAVLSCERLLGILESNRKQTLDPNGPFGAPTSDALARHRNGSFEAGLFEGESLLASSDRNTDPPAVDTPAVDFLAVARAERLSDYHESPLYQEHLETPTEHFLTADQRALRTRYRERPVGRDADMRLQAARRPSESRHNDPAPAMTVAASEKIARKVDSESFDPEGGIARNYLAREGTDAPTGAGRDSDRTLFSRSDGISSENIPTLSTVRLMQLLQHRDGQIVARARQTLIDRDGFRDRHLRLALRLYHPDPRVREEIVALLPDTKGVQTSVWLAELLNDPDKDVRYRAASCLATGSDPAMRRLLIDKGKRDTDQRIVDLANRLLQSQAGKR